MTLEAHGGEIGVVSNEGTGAEFWFKLPGILKSNAVTNHSFQVEEEELEAAVIQKLRPVLFKLKSLKIYQSTEIERVLDEVPRTPGSALDKYCKRIIDAAYQVNESLYYQLIEYDLPDSDS